MSGSGAAEGEGPKGLISTAEELEAWRDGTAEAQTEGTKGLISTAEELAAWRGDEKTAPKTGAESTTINDDPTIHTPEQQAVIDAYKNSVDGGLKAFVERVKTLENPSYRNSVRYSISEVSARSVDAVSRLSGVDATGFENIITGGTVDHIENRHGAHGKADMSMANIDDIARVGYVLDNFDGAFMLTNKDGSPSVSDVWKNSDGSPANRIAFFKKIDGTYYVVEATPDSNAKVLAIESAFIGSEENIKRGSNGTVLNMTQGVPQVTPVAPQRANASSEGSLSQSAPNRQEENSGGVRGLISTAEELEAWRAGTAEEDRARSVEETAKKPTEYRALPRTMDELREMWREAEADAAEAEAEATAQAEAENAAAERAETPGKTHPPRHSARGSGLKQMVRSNRRRAGDDAVRYQPTAFTGAKRQSRLCA